MKTLIFFLSALVLSALPSMSTAQPLARVNPETVGLDASRLANADTAIQAEMSQGHIPGAVLAVVRHGKMTWLKAYGHRAVWPKRLPMTVNTVFDLASCSKPLSTAIAVMQLMEKGELRLNDPVSLFIPHFKSWRQGADTTTIRLVHLLTHTSGLPPYAPVEQIRARCGSPCADSLMEYISTCRRDFAPESGFQYSCLNFVTLQHIVETVTHQSLRDYAARHIFLPLGMAHTDYLPCKADARGRWVNTDQPRWVKLGEHPDETPIAPTERQKDGTVLLGQVHDPLARVLNGGISGNAGLFSTADDIAVLCACLLNGGSWNGYRLLAPRTVETMRTVPPQLAKFGRALGWDVCSPYASNKGDLLSPSTYSHTGYTGTSVVIDPDNDLAIILLINAVHPVDKYSVVRLRSLVANVVAGAITEQ